MQTETTRTSARGGTEVAKRPERLAVTGYALTSGATGEHFEFATSARTSVDRMFRFVWTLAPGKKGPGEHYHETETETFEIVSGTIRIWREGVAEDFGPGDVCVVKPGVVHRFLNPGVEPVVINVSLDGPRMEDLFLPAAIALHEKQSQLGAVLRMVAAFDRWASTPSSAIARGLFVVLARTVRLFGVAPARAAHGWDTSAPR